MEKRFELGAHGPTLWTRERGRAIRTELEQLFEDSQEGDCLVVDAKGVEAFDYSFANELFGKLILKLPIEFPGRLLLVQNLGRDVRDNLEQALQALSLAMLERTATRLELIGRVHPADRETLQALRKTKSPLTALDLSQKLDVKLTAINERLSKLANLGLVLRSESVSAAGRTQYEYRLPT